MARSPRATQNIADVSMGHRAIRMLKHLHSRFFLHRAAERECADKDFFDQDMSARCRERKSRSVDTSFQYLRNKGFDLFRSDQEMFWGRTTRLSGSTRQAASRPVTPVEL